MKRRQHINPESWFKKTAVNICPLCEREIPPSQLDEHHLVPKSKGGRLTQHMHRICHRQLHALFSEAELAQQYNTIDSLLADEEVQKFVAWVKSKPITFIERTRLSGRRK